MRNVVVILTLFLCSCGKAPVTVDQSLLPYFKGYEVDVGISSDGVSGKLGTLDNPAVGQCQVEQAGSIKTITIDTAYWANATDDERREVVYHELSHCTMNLQHINTYDSNNCPTSIMFASVFGSTKCFKMHRQHYYQELTSHAH